MDKLKVGIVGYGMATKTFHLPLLNAHGGYDLKAFVSSKEDEIKRSYPKALVYAKLEEMLSQVNLDLVIIVTPPKTHYELAKQALLAGKNVVVEKPFVVHSKEGQELIDLAQNKNVLLSVFHNRRWDNDFLTIKHLIEKKELGEIKLFESHFDRYRPIVKDRWRENAGEGSGILYDLGSHLIDQALDLFGKPDKILADLAEQRAHAETVDYFHLQFLYHNGLRVILHGSSFGATAPRFQVQGTKKAYVKWGVDSQEDQLKAGKTPLDPEYGIESSSLSGKLVDWEGDTEEIIKSEKGLYHLYYENIYDVITQDAKLKVSPEQALEVIEVIEKSYLLASDHS